MKINLAACVAVAASLFCVSLPAVAFTFSIGDDFNGSLNSTLSYGVQMRMQDRSCTLIGQDNGGCAQLGGDLPGSSQDAFFLNADDGDLNYKKHQVVSAAIKGTHELQL